MTQPIQQRSARPQTCRGFLFAFLAGAALFRPAVVLQAAEPEVLAFRVAAADGTSVSGTLQELRPDWSVTVGGGTRAEVKGSELISLRRSGMPLPALPTGPQLIFANGDRVPGTPRKLAGERLHFAAQLGKVQEVSVPLSALSVLWLAAPEGVLDRERLQRRLAMEPRTRDVVLLRNGDQVEGTLTALDPPLLRLDADGREVSMECDKVTALALNTELVRTLRPRTTYGHLVLANGCRLSVSSARLRDRTLTLRTLFGSNIEVALEQVQALDLYQGRAVYLSDLKPRRFEQTPYFGLRWPYVRDGSVAGRDLRLDGSTYEKGLGMHSASRLTYDLAGDYQWFEALVGLDDLSGRQGSVQIRILLDGRAQPLGWDEELTALGGPRTLRIRVAGARELTLEVQLGRRGDVQDHVNWADARLIK